MHITSLINTKLRENKNAIPLATTRDIYDLLVKNKNSPEEKQHNYQKDIFTVSKFTSLFK